MYIDLTWVILAGLLAAFFYQLYSIYKTVQGYRRNRRTKP